MPPYSTKFRLVIVLCLLVLRGNILGQVSPKESALPDGLADFARKYQAAITKSNLPLSRLKASYIAKLEELKSAEQTSGNLGNVLVVTKELDLTKIKEPGKNSAFRKLATLQGIYHQHAETAAPRVYIGNVRIETAYTKGLEGLIMEYTKNGKLEDALLVRELLSKSKDRNRKWNRLASAGSSDHDPFAFFDWKGLGEIIQANKLTRSGSFGGASQSNETTKDLPVEPSLLIGFDLYMGPFRESKETVRKIIPLYRTEKNLIVEGIPRAAAKGGNKRRVIAKKGYVLSGVTSHSEAGIRKVKFEFQRLKGMQSDKADSYETDWYGSWDGGRIASLSTDQKLAVGVDGWVGLGTGETWLILAEP